LLQSRLPRFADAADSTGDIMKLEKLKDWIGRRVTIRAPLIADAEFK
jgi:hypothetical protein